MITGLGFITFQSALEDKAMILRKEGGGNNQTKACLIKEEVETCLKSGQFGCYFPLEFLHDILVCGVGRNTTQRKQRTLP